MYFGQVEPASKHDIESIVEDQANFYCMLFAATGIPPMKEDYKLSDLKIQFDVHLRFACVEDENVFRTILRMSTNFNMGLTFYSKGRNLRSNSRMAITWLCLLKALTDAYRCIHSIICTTMFNWA
jgi:hypothetical protein